MFENVKDWLDKGKTEKVVGYAILFIAVYGIVWGLVEPIISSDIIEKYFGSDSIKYWWKYQLGLSFLFTTILFLVLVPKKILQRIGSAANDTILDHKYRTHGNPVITVFNDGFYGKVYEVDARQQQDQMDYEILPGANSASQIIYTYIPEEDFRLYLRVAVLSKSRTEEKLVWIRLVTNISLPDKANGQEEMAYPVTGENTKGGWIRTRVSIKEAVKATFGQENWQYDKLVLIRVRGKAKVQSIVVR